jgi:hypothetical protein
VLISVSCLAGLIACGPSGSVNGTGGQGGGTSASGGRPGAGSGASLGGDAALIDGSAGLSSAATSGASSLGGANAGGAGSAPSCPDQEVWRAMSVEGIQWPTGVDSSSQSPPARAPSGWYQGLVYVLRFPLELLTFDPCANAWQTVSLNFTGADVEAAIGPIGSAQWVEDHFVVLASGQADPKVAELRPGADSFVVLPLSSWQAPEPVWSFPPLAAGRWPGTARTAASQLDWGGAYTNDATRISPTDPKSAPTADGKIYTFGTGSWRATNGRGAPSARYLPKLAPLAERYFVWGGFADSAWPYVTPGSALADGAIYDPASDSWSPVSADGAPVQLEVGAVTAPPHMFARSNGVEVFVVDPDQGQGGVYDSARNTWAAVNATPLPVNAEFELLDDGDLVAIGATDTWLMAKKGGDWRKFTQGRYQDSLPSAAGLPDPDGFSIAVWTGRTLVHWGPFTDRQIGCDGPRPPNTGCDPLRIVANYKFGSLLSVTAMLPP